MRCIRLQRKEGRNFLLLPFEGSSITLIARDRRGRPGLSDCEGIRPRFSWEISCGTPPSGRMCACQKRGEPDLKQMKCKLNRARRETAEIRSTGPRSASGQTRSDVGRNAILLRRGSCGASRRFLFSLSRSGREGIESGTACWKRRARASSLPTKLVTSPARNSRVTAPRNVERKGKRFASFRSLEKREEDRI